MAVRAFSLARRLLNVFKTVVGRDGRIATRLEGKTFLQHKIISDEGGGIEIRQLTCSTTSLAHSLL